MSIYSRMHVLACLHNIYYDNYTVAITTRAITEAALYVLL